MAQQVYQQISVKEFATHIPTEKLMVVCGKSCSKLQVAGELEELGIKKVWFDGFAPNPTYESVCEGVELFRKEKCDAVLAIGGGSCMDVAKCIALFSDMNPGENYLSQLSRGYRPAQSVSLAVVPTTAGTGSEATRYAVIYMNDIKQSVTHESIVPGYVLFRTDALSSLSDYHRKATAMDALCHAVESMWSVNSNEESRGYAKQAIGLIVKCAKGYFDKDEGDTEEMLQAAYTAGKAINITQTTAGHAMCYKLTSLYGFAHGHAAGLCVRKLWKYMLSNKTDCIDPRGEAFLTGIFEQLAEAFGEEKPENGLKRFEEIFAETGLEIPQLTSEEQLDVLVKSVNPDRLKNNPVALNEGTILGLYREILADRAGE